MTKIVIYDIVLYIFYQKLLGDGTPSPSFFVVVNPQIVWGFTTPRKEQE